MMGHNHLASGVVTGSLVATFTHLPPDKAVAFICVTSVCALLPDFDHPGATLPRALWWPGRAVAAIIGHVFGHRTLTHSVLGVGLLGAGMVFIPHLPEHCYWAVILGCVTHILGDMLTVSGVPIFWPHQRVFRIGFKRFAFRTDGDLEKIVVTPLLAIAAAASIGLVVVSNA